MNILTHQHASVIIFINTIEQLRIVAEEDCWNVYFKNRCDFLSGKDLYETSI